MVVGHIIVLDIQTVIGDCNGNMAHRKKILATSKKYPR
jgi:hypothetical protein